MNPGRPFNLDDLQFEKKRLAKRRKLLLISLAPCLLVGLVAIKFISIPVFSSIAHKQYQQSNAASALHTLQPLEIGNWFESYILNYDQGIAYYQQADFSSSEGKFRAALATVPAQHECDVRINLVLAVVAQADALVANKKYDQAIIRYDDAKAVLRDGQINCNVQLSDTGNQAAGKNAEDAQQLNNEVQEKSNQAKAARNGDKADNSESGTTDSNDTQSKLDKLEQQATNAQKQRSVQQQFNQTTREIDSGQSKNYNAKNW